MNGSLPQSFEVSREVREALAQRQPIVALESTIVSHGMPYPQNVQTARDVERVVRECGAIPATVAIIAGRVRIGLDHDSLETIARGGEVRKVSVADLSAAIVSASNGATTVAATMRCAHRAGIAVFATGGIGGVHRGAERNFDVSADLYELARTPVAVICAGAKALLDLPKTLELMESLGVPVVVRGSDEFPAFWSRASGLAAPIRIDSAPEIARLVVTHRGLGSRTGIVVANPIAVESEIPRPEMERYIEAAVRESQELGVAGKAVTPWILERLNALTSGRSLVANMALVRQNAALAAQVARELSVTSAALA